jgi:hypothetical protein
MKQSAFELIKWPINICALDLALGFGVGKALRLAFQPSPVPTVFLVVSVALVGFTSAWTVSRYMPSDEALEHSGKDTAVSTWITVSLLLSTLVPILGVIYVESLVFWLVSVAVASAKAIHSLEEQRIKTEPKSIFQNERPIHISPSNILQRYIYSAQPDAYAPKPRPTAILLTTQAVGVSMVLISGKTYAAFGIILIVLGNGLYNILSGLARRDGRPSS